eukprot:3239855-Alexandrium_andersonii.AAC.1
MADRITPGGNSAPLEQLEAWRFRQAIGATGALARATSESTGTAGRAVSYTHLRAHETSAHL